MFDKIIYENKNDLKDMNIYYAIYYNLVNTYLFNSRWEVVLIGDIKFADAKKTFK